MSARAGLRRVRCVAVCSAPRHCASTLCLCRCPVPRAPPPRRRAAPPPAAYCLRSWCAAETRACATAAHISTHECPTHRLRRSAAAAHRGTHRLLLLFGGAECGARGVAGGHIQRCFAHLSSSGVATTNTECAQQGASANDGGAGSSSARSARGAMGGGTRTQHAAAAAAVGEGAAQRTLFFASLLAPRSTSSATHTTWPLRAAQCSGVLSRCAYPQQRSAAAEGEAAAVSAQHGTTRAPQQQGRAGLMRSRSAQPRRMRREGRVKRRAQPPCSAASALARRGSGRCQQTDRAAAASRHRLRS